MTRWPALLLGLLLAVVSWHTASNLGGAAVAVGYAVLIIAATVVLAPWAVERLRAAPPWVLPAAVGGAVVLLAVVFVLGVPPAYRDAMGVGSDRADALNVALGRLVAGDYPYTATTYLGNPISPLPGALLLAAPFWWLTGNAGTQNVGWTVLLLPLLAGGWRLRARPAVLWLLASVGGLEVLREFLIGGDLVTGAVPALAAVAGTLAAARRPSVGVLAAAAVALGVTTCTRPHLILVVVIVTAAVAGVAGTRWAVVVGAVAGLTWLALIVPFLLGGAARFSPLHVAAKVTGERGFSVAIALVALGALAVVAVALRAVRPRSPASVGWCVAAVLFAPTVLSLARGVTIGPLADIDVTLGAAAVPFVLWAVAGDGRETRSPGSDPGLEPGRDLTLDPGLDPAVAARRAQERAGTAEA